MFGNVPDVTDDKCHQDVGTFPNKRLVLDDSNVIEVFDKYFKYTTITNSAGDYMLFGLPVGVNIIHSELDLSDIGMLSQKPRDLYYKGYNKTQFENSSQFKKDTNLDYLTQIISQDNPVQVYPFWGNDESENYDGVDKQVKITREDIDVNFKFEPTCIFIGSLVADDKSNGFSKKCVPTERSGKMDKLTTGAGTIEMIRKTPDNNVESFSVQGNELIDGSGTWCYQIPMNLDFVKTDEYGNLVAAESEMVGIPTRAKVRFRISLGDYESDNTSVHLPKVLVPNNPTLTELMKPGENGGVDYNFGTFTRDESFKDLLWNNVYTVKQYIPRIQNIIFEGPHIDRNKNFSGFKAVNVNGGNNPIPYNNIRVQLTFLFIFQCIIFKSLILIVKILNSIIYAIQKMSQFLTCGCGASKCTCFGNFSYIVLDGSMCPTMEGIQMAIGAKPSKKDNGNIDTSAALLIGNTLKKNLVADGSYNDNNKNSEDGKVDDVEKTSEIDSKSSDNKYYNVNNDSKVYTSQYDSAQKTDPMQAYSSTITNIFNRAQKLSMEKLVSAEGDYFVKCVELQFAMEYEVIQFDFYNDWINGLIYLPRWFAELKRRKRVDYVVACNENYMGSRHLVQQCALNYQNINQKLVTNTTENDCGTKCHKQTGRKYVKILHKNGGIIQTVKNHMDDKYVYYLRPSVLLTNKKALLFATDIVLLGSVSECNRYGLPLANGYPSSTFILPPATGQILSDSQEMSLYFNDDDKYIGYSVQKNNRNKIEKKIGFFISQNKRLPHQNQSDYETTQVEVSGIDWGYNPFTLNESDDTTKINNQQGGHFLEIGCVAAATTQKSCLNLQRICEIGAEMSQSHYYRHRNNFGTGDNYTFISTTGTISTMEIVGEDMRTKFATLNSNALGIITDKDDMFLRYKLMGYTPYSFNGSFSYMSGDEEKNTFISGLDDVTSTSYIAFRFAHDLKDLSINKNKQIQTYNKYLLNIGGTGNRRYAIPIYENSFYFYFGLKDGNTAIDRFYGEYFSNCESNMSETKEDVLVGKGESHPFVLTFGNTKVSDNGAFDCTEQSLDYVSISIVSYGVAGSKEEEIARYTTYGVKNLTFSKETSPSYRDGQRIAVFVKNTTPTSHGTLKVFDVPETDRNVEEFSFTFEILGEYEKALRKSVGINYKQTVKMY